MSVNEGEIADDLVFEEALGSLSKICKSLTVLVVSALKRLISPVLLYFSEEKTLIYRPLRPVVRVMPIPRSFTSGNREKADEPDDACRSSPDCGRC